MLLDPPDQYDDRLWQYVVADVPLRGVGGEGGGDYCKVINYRRRWEEREGSRVGKRAATL